MAELVVHRFDRREIFGVRDSFLECFDDLFVIQPVRRRIEQRFAIRDRHAAPLANERHEVRFHMRFGCARAFRAHCPSMLEELVEDLFLFCVVSDAHDFIAELRRHRFITLEDLLDLNRVIREQLRCCINRRQSSANHYRG